MYLVPAWAAPGALPQAGEVPSAPRCQELSGEAGMSDLVPCLFPASISEIIIRGFLGVLQWRTAWTFSHRPGLPAGLDPMSSPWAL